MTMAARANDCRAAAPLRVFVIDFFRIFYNVNVFYKTNYRSWC